MERFTLPALDSNFMNISRDLNVKEDSQSDLSGAGEVLWKAQEDIRQMKEDILKETGASSATSEKLRGIIEKVEDSIKKQTESIVKSVNNRCEVIPEISNVGRKSSPKKYPQNIAASNSPAVVRSRLQSTVGPGVPPPGQQFMNLQKLKAIINPLSKDARKLLNEKYSVPLPLSRIRNKDEEEGDEDIASKPKLKRKSLSANLTRGAIKDTNAPPQMNADDANQGMRFLIERQFIPAYAKITLEPPPIQSKQLTLYAHQKHSEERETENTTEVSVSEQKMDFAKAIELVDAGQGESRQSRVTFREQAKVIAPKEEVTLSKCSYQFGNKPNARKFSTLTDSASTRAERFLAPCSSPTFEDDTVLHKFMVQNGKTRNNSEEFIKFKGTYQTAWGSIVSLLKKMEKFLVDYSIPVAMINGDQFADLALYFDGNATPTTEDLLTCILNSDDVGRILMIPGRRYIAPDGQEEAATKIQSSYRRYKDRKAYLLYRKRKWAAGLLALNWIMICKVSLIRKQLKLAREGHLARYKMRFKTLRSSWEKLKSSKRVIIHIPSLGYTQQVRKTLYDLDDRQNRQIGRIFEASDPNVEVIYIWPWKFSDDTEKYYMKLLDLSDQRQSDAEPASQRCTLLSPESSHRFPSHNMCVSTLLKYSPRVLHRLQSLIKGKNAYIVPGLMHKDDLYIADYLDVPILGCEPEVATLYSSKSGARRIFEDAKVDRGPSDTDIYTINQLNESLADLVTTHLDIKRWLFKIDDEVDGRGIAYCDLVSYLDCYTWVQKEAKRYGEKWDKKWAREKAYMKVMAEIPEILEKYAVVLDKKRFSSWKGYLNEYLNKGGTIEACPPSESTTSLSVDVLIEPTGNTNIISAADQMNGRGKYRCLGYTFPQLSVEPAVLQKLTHDICSCCKNRGIVGYIVINFVTFIDPVSLQQRVWPVGLDLSYGISYSSFNIMRHVTKGAFSFDNNLFTAPILSKTARQPYRSGRRKTAQRREEKCSIEQRFAVFSHVLQHDSLRSVQSSVLFQLCKSHGIGYDIKAKLGTLFTVIDQLHKDSFGILTIGVSMQEALSSFALNLSLIHRDTSVHDKLSKSNLQDLISEIQLILDVSVANSQPQDATSPKHQDGDGDGGGNNGSDCADGGDGDKKLEKASCKPSDGSETETNSNAVGLPCPTPITLSNSSN